MPNLSAQFNSDQHVVTFTLTMPVMTAAELTREYEAILDNPALLMDMDSIWDISRLDLKRIPISEIRQLPRLMNRLMNRRGAGFRVAIVTGRAADQMLLRMYLTILKLIRGPRYKLFLSVDEALAWLVARTA